MKINMKIFVSMPVGSAVTNSFFTDEARAYIEGKYEVIYSDSEAHLSPDEIIEKAADCDVIMTGWGHTVLTYDILKNTKIKLIAHTGGTVANVADQSVYENGIKVFSGNIIYAESVAEGVIGYMLTGLRRIPYYVDKVRNGEWHEPTPLTEGLLEQTVGIIGLGTISRYLIKMLQAFNVNIKIYSSYKIDEQFLKENNAVQVTSIEEIFSSCKIVSVHSAMNEKNRGMIGKEHFDLLQDGALFINTARGAIIREDEMIEALRENRFRAVLDVYCQEPLDLDSPLRKLENVYCIPHLGGPTIDRRGSVTKALIDNVGKFERGEEAELEIKLEAAKRMTVGG